MTKYVYADPTTDLEVEIELKRYPDFPDVMDWVIKLQNKGYSDTPIISDIQPLSLSIASHNGDSVVHHARGSDALATDFEPLEEHFGPGGSVHLKSSGGDSSNGPTLPFFNLETGGGGLVGAIGWTGNWKVDFDYAKDGQSILIDGGMQKTHLVLHPGEQVRTPRIVLMPWRGGDWQSVQNRWRQFLLAHFTPKASSTGGPMKGPVLVGSWGAEPIDEKLALIHWIRDERIPIDVYAVDAGWYGKSSGSEHSSENPWWQSRGDWYPNHRNYPRGLRPLGKVLSAADIGFSLWVEPETTMRGSKLFRSHPEWLLGTDNPAMADAELLNLGNPAALGSITKMLSGLIRKYQITWYRQDFNIRPERYWQLADTPDRIGMTEIRYIEGLYHMLDQLLVEHPGLRIDNCASGGRRLDIEMMSRSFVVWRTDYGTSDTVANQAQTQALAPWVPMTMSFGSSRDPNPWSSPGPYDTSESMYRMRLGYSTGYGLTPGATGLRNDEWVSWIKQMIQEYREVQPFFYGDFYPLAPYSLSSAAWTVWQWQRPEKKDGLIVLLRRSGSPLTEKALDLKDINEDALYDVQVRTNQILNKKMTGQQLRDLQIRLPDAPSSALVFYKRAVIESSSSIEAFR